MPELFTDDDDQSLIALKNADEEAAQPDNDNAEEREQAHNDSAANMDNNQVLDQQQEPSGSICIKFSRCPSLKRSCCLYLLSDFYSSGAEESDDYFG